MLVSPNSGGYLYHPYMRNASGVYAPNTTVIHNSVHVTNVYYGNNPKAVSYSSTTKSSYKMPKGYSSTSYKIGDSTAQMSGGKISTVKGVTSKSVLQNNGKIPTVTGKTGSGVNSSSGSKFGSGSNKSGSTGGSNTSKSSGSKFGSGSSRTSKH